MKGYGDGDGYGDVDGYVSISMCTDINRGKADRQAVSNKSC